jgi:cytochrome c oxidase subunit 3
MATTIAAPPHASVPQDIGRDGGSGSIPSGVNRTGVLLGLAAVSMMFIGLTSAYVVSQGLSPLWKQVHLSPLIWINTAVLLSSSYAMEQARRGISRRWLIGALFLGLAFLAGQLGVFRQLANEGLYLSTGRQASFYYVLSGLHGLHILGGIMALAWTAVRMKRSTLELTSLYWHYMGGLWIYLLLVVFL